RWTFPQRLTRIWKKIRLHEKGGITLAIRYRMNIKLSSGEVIPAEFEIPEPIASGDISLGITGAEVGKVLYVSEVDASGAPKKWGVKDDETAEDGNGVSY
ncbi:MAG: hypothetical protein ACI3XQ_11520, partial [Eubacteriales bacterium]